MIIRNNLEDEVYEAIITRLINGYYQEGQRIDINELKKELGVSATPVLNALRRLVHAQLLVAPPRSKGYYVPSYSREDFEESKVALNMMSLVAFEKICLLDNVEKQVAKLELFAEKTLKARDSGDYFKYIRADHEFHLEIIRCLNSGLLLNIYRNLSNQYLCMIHRFLPDAVGDTSVVDVDMHFIFCECLRTRNHERIYSETMRTLRKQGVYLEAEDTMDVTATLKAALRTTEPDGDV